MSVSEITSKVGLLTPRQRMLAMGLTAAVASVPLGRSDAVSLIIRLSLWFGLGSVIELTLEAVRGATWDRRAFIAYLPLACASLAFFLAQGTANHVMRSGSLDSFFEGAISLLGLLLVSLVVEARRVAAYDQWIRALRGWWIAFVIVGILFALLGLTPGRRSQKNDYACVWSGLVGAVVALTVVMCRDLTPQLGAVPIEPRLSRPQKEESANGLTAGAASTSTRTLGRSTRA